MLRWKDLEQFERDWIAENSFYCEWELEFASFERDIDEETGEHCVYLIEPETTH